jgi:hypothetical protein
MEADGNNKDSQEKAMVVFDPKVSGGKRDETDVRKLLNQCSLQHF